MIYLAFLLILALFCGVLALCGWIADRRKPNTMARYTTRWPKTNGFRGY